MTGCSTGNPCQLKRGWPMKSPWELTPFRSRWPVDQLLRRRGFVIHARPRNRPAVWSRDGVLYIESEAIKVSLRERARR